MKSHYLSDTDIKLYESLTCEKPNLNEESYRVNILRQTELIGSNFYDPSYDRYTAIVKRLFEVSNAFVYVIDIKDAYLKSFSGDCLSVKFCRTDPFLCFPILSESPDVFVVNDLSEDPRFNNQNCLISGNMKIRFYACTPILLHGAKIGLLGILDSKPRTKLTLDDKMNLLDFGAGNLFFVCCMSIFHMSIEVFVFQGIVFEVNFMFVCSLI